MTWRTDERTDARERALILLYEAESKGITAGEVLAAQISPADELTTLIVEGVAANQAALDEAIGAHAKGWTLQRMPSIDRNVLRIASFELMGRADVPIAVVLDEAVELAKRFSTDDSGRFVNGVLSALVPVLRFLIRTLGAGWSGGFPSGFPDSASYLEVADRGPLSLQFWFGERPLMLPLLSWLLAGNVLMIVLVQSLLAVAATWWAVIVLVRVVHSPLARALGIVLLVGVAVQSRFALWNTLLLSESLSITAGVAMIATWVWCAHEPSVRRIGWVAAATVAWALVRDSNVAIVVAIVIPGLLLVAWCSRDRSPAIARSTRVTVGVLLVAALFAFVGQTASQRNRYPTLNVIGQRVLVSAELTDLYSSFGMPTDATVLNAPATARSTTGSRR
jgi:N utilization substance protein B